jgi:hypothetical protein
LSTRRSLEDAALKPAYKGRWLAFGLDLMCPVLVRCESPIAQVSDYSVQPLAAHEKYENSLRLCSQNFQYLIASMSPMGFSMLNWASSKKAKPNQYNRLVYKAPKKKCKVWS